MSHQTQQQPNHHKEPTARPRDVMQGARTAVREAQARLKPIDRWVRATVAQHPYLSVGITAGASVLSGLLIRRSTALGAGAAFGFCLGCLASRRLME